MRAIRSAKNLSQSLPQIKSRSESELVPDPFPRVARITGQFSDSVERERKSTPRHRAKKIGHRAGKHRGWKGKMEQSAPISQQLGNRRGDLLLGVGSRIGHNVGATSTPVILSGENCRIDRVADSKHTLSVLAVTNDQVAMAADSVDEMGDISPITATVDHRQAQNCHPGPCGGAAL